MVIPEMSNTLTLGKTMSLKPNSTQCVVSVTQPCYYHHHDLSKGLTKRTTTAKETSVWWGLTREHLMKRGATEMAFKLSSRRT